MKLVVLYRPNSAHGRLTEEFIHDFQRFNPNQQVETLNIDSREGSAMAVLYDIIQYPGIIVVQSDGHVLKTWQGEELPLINEVASYTRL